MQVKDVTDIMRENVQKIIERDQKINDVLDSSEKLRDSASFFQRTAVKLRRKMWWKNTKFTLILAGIVILLIGIIVIIGESRPFKFTAGVCRAKTHRLLCSQ
jgi:hypothetical protein